MLGFLNVLKPAGMTSHDVVARLRKLTGIKQIGHAGTLDPAATGVLPLALGSACRLLRFLGTDKTYVAEFLLGTRTTTDDLEGAVLAQIPVEALVIEQVESALADLVGIQKQIPPAYSAVHHDGKRLYELARMGKLPADVKPRSITVDAIEILEVNIPVLRLRVRCSGGTYIRAIARDLGDKLGVGACLKSLLREKSGPFLLSVARSLEELASLAESGRLLEALIPPEQVLDIDIVNVDRDAARMVASGQNLPLASISLVSKNDDKLCLVMFEHSLIALCAVTQDNKLQPEVVVRNAKSLA